MPLDRRDGAAIQRHASEPRTPYTGPGFCRACGLDFPYFEAYDPAPTIGAHCWMLSMDAGNPCRAWLIEQRLARLNDRPAKTFPT